MFTFCLVTYQWMGILAGVPSATMNMCAHFSGLYPQEHGGIFCNSRIFMLNETHETLQHRFYSILFFY